MKENIVIGIEGLVGAGKTSLCLELLEIIPNSVIMHGGSLYRAIVYALLNSGISIDKLVNNIKDSDIKQIMEQYSISFKIENRESVFYIAENRIADNDLQSKEVSMGVSMVSNVADNKKLFEYGKELLENLKKEYNVIFSSRAIMQTYPKIDYHFFITADLQERIKRKSIQYKGKMSEEEVAKHIQKRDELQEKTGFYKISPNTIVLDVTNCKSPKESAEFLMEHVKLPVNI